MPAAPSDDPLLPPYDEEALAEIELTSSVMVAANASEDALDGAELDRALGVSRERG